MKSKVSKDNNIKYPFHMIKSLENNKCLGVNNQKIYVGECIDNRNQHWKPLPINKTCR